MRLRNVLALVLLLPTVGCEAAFISTERTDSGLSGPDGGVDMMEDGGFEPTARDLFEDEVLPLLDAQCAACHIADRTGPAFMTADPDVYTTVLDWPSLVQRSDVSSSRLVAKGLHAGPAWTGAQETVITEWIRLEAEEGGEDVEATPETEKQSIVPGLNNFPLDNLGLTGSALTFIAEENAAGFYISQLKVTAGTGGVRLLHPVVMKWIGGAPVPARDDFAGLEVIAPEYTEAMIGGGTFTLVGLTSEELVSFHFDEAGPAAGDTEPLPGVGGCDAVAAFTGAMRPQLTTHCTSCHGGANLDAVAAVDMTQVENTELAAQQAACNEILTRINTANVLGSTLLLTVDPARTSGHAFRLPAGAPMTAFSAALLDWIALEAL